MNNMYCFQCEQTFDGRGCRNDFGQCGKDANAAALQDLIVHSLEGLAVYAHRARQLGETDAEVDSATLEALFTTLTNVNFDPERLGGIVDQVVELRDRMKTRYEAACARAGREPETLVGAATFAPADELEAMVGQAAPVGIAQRKGELAEDILSLQELITYGLKGLAAYAYHAEVMGATDPSIYGFVHEALSFLTEQHTVEELVAMSLRVGEVNLTAMALLDAANTGTFGHPSPTQVRVTPVPGKAILISGHELKDLAALLRQTAGKGIQVYTHGEMLPAHGYPELRCYPHLAGNYGGAWQLQAQEFAAFPGPILMTTNCIQRPEPSYKARIFTSGPVAWPGVTHIDDQDFTPVIEAALAAPGFEGVVEEQTITVGFGRNAVLGVAGEVVSAVKSGAIKHFFLIGGCDGNKPGRDYYTELAEKVPSDCVILTLGCGKYRFHKRDFGDIGGIPRLLDVGQCNDAYSAIQIAVALADAFDTDVNSLPLSLVLSWYEQKAVVILLSLLHLGIKKIRLGPTLPAFLSKNVVELLVGNYDLMPITTPENDLRQILANPAAA